MSREQLPRGAKRNSMQISADTTVASKKVKRIGNSKDSRMKLEERIRVRAPINEFVKGEIVLGKIPGFAPWPARIKDIIGDTVFIEFFGTGEM